MVDRVKKGRVEIRLFAGDWAKMLDRAKKSTPRHFPTRIFVRPRENNTHRKFVEIPIWQRKRSPTREHPTFWLAGVADLGFCPGSSNSYPLGYLKRGETRKRRMGRH